MAVAWLRVLTSKCEGLWRKAYLSWWVDERTTFWSKMIGNSRRLLLLCVCVGCVVEFSWLLFCLHVLCEWGDNQESFAVRVTDANNSVGWLCVCACLLLTTMMSNIICMQASCPCFGPDCGKLSERNCQDSLLFDNRVESEANWSKCVLTSRWETLPLARLITRQSWVGRASACLVFLSFSERRKMRASDLSA